MKTKMGGGDQSQNRFLTIVNKLKVAKGEGMRGRVKWVTGLRGTRVTSTA